MNKELNEKLKKNIRENLVDLRLQHGKTQQDIATETKKSVNAVGSWEQGLSLPDIYTLYRLSKYYKVSMEYFYEHKKGDDE